MDLDKTIRELAAEAQRLEELAARFRKAIAALEGVDVEPVAEPEAPASKRALDLLRAHPDPERPTPRPARITLEQVRDAGRELGDFNVPAIMERIGASVGQRSSVAKMVGELTEKGTFIRHGGEKGPTVSWSFDKPEGDSRPRPRKAPTPEQELVAGRRGSNVVSLTGRPKGPSGRPGRDKKTQATGRRVKKRAAKGHS